MTAGMWLSSDQRVPTEYLTQPALSATHPARPVRHMYDIILGINLSLFMLVGFYSIILAYKRLVRPGVSIEMRKLFLKKHALYVVALIIIWIFCLLYNYYDLFNPYNALSQLHMHELEFSAQLESPLVQKVSYIAMFSTGVVMVSIRIFDPFFRFLVQ